MKTEILDRSIPPQAKPFQKLALPNYEVSSLHNGIKVYELPYGDSPVVEVKAIFHTGISYQAKPGLASFTARNMLEGTESFTSLELAQILDSLGAWISYDIDQEYVSFNLATITSHLTEALPLLKEVITKAVFPESEFQHMKKRDLERLKIESQKTSFHARRIFKQTLFGSSHPYGMHTGEEEIEAISYQDIVHFYHSQITLANLSITVVGKFEPSSIRDLLNKEIGLLDIPIIQPIVSQIPSLTPPLASGRIHKEISGMQSTIRLGHFGMKRSHPDFYKMTVVNTILGGFFGSRLMQSIREKKGYTYGIYAAWIAFKENGIFYIQSDLANQYVEKAIQAIKHEIQLLIEEEVSDKELSLVKNYLMGQSISQRETPFQIGNILRFSIAYDIPMSELDKRFEEYEKLNPADVKSLAEKYYQPEGWLEVVCGEKTA